MEHITYSNVNKAGNTSAWLCLSGLAVQWLKKIKNSQKSGENHFYSLEFGFYGFKRNIKHPLYSLLFAFIRLSINLKFMHSSGILRNAYFEASEPTIAQGKQSNTNWGGIRTCYNSASQRSDTVIPGGRAWMGRREESGPETSSPKAGGRGVTGTHSPPPPLFPTWESSGGGEGSPSPPPSTLGLGTSPYKAGVPSRAGACPRPRTVMRLSSSLATRVAASADDVVGL